MELLLNRRSINRVAVEVGAETMNLKHQQVLQPSSSCIEDIRLKMMVQFVCNHFLVEQNRETLLVRQHESPKFFFLTHQLPVESFNHCDGTLLHFLSSKLAVYSNPIINANNIVVEIINKWRVIKQVVDSSGFGGKVFPLTVTLKLWNVSMSYERPSFMDQNVEDTAVVPTSNNAIETMLTRVSMEEIKSDDEACVICLEPIEKQKENAMLLLLKMPCLHVFHEECLLKWLKTSHYCPICRFLMPTQ